MKIFFLRGDPWDIIENESAWPPLGKNFFTRKNFLFPLVFICDSWSFPMPTDGFAPNCSALGGIIQKLEQKYRKISTFASFGEFLTTAGKRKYGHVGIYKLVGP